MAVTFCGTEPVESTATASELEKITPVAVVSFPFEPSTVGKGVLSGDPDVLKNRVKVCPTGL